MKHPISLFVAFVLLTACIPTNNEIKDNNNDSLTKDVTSGPQNNNMYSFGNAFIDNLTTSLAETTLFREITSTPTLILVSRTYYGDLMIEIPTKEYNAELSIQSVANTLVASLLFSIPEIIVDYQEGNQKKQAILNLKLTNVHGLQSFHIDIISFDTKYQSNYYNMLYDVKSKELKPTQDINLNFVLSPQLKQAIDQIVTDRYDDLATKMKQLIKTINHIKNYVRKYADDSQIYYADSYQNMERKTTIEQTLQRSYLYENCDCAYSFGLQSDQYTPDKMKLMRTLTATFHLKEEFTTPKNLEITNEIASYLIHRSIHYVPDYEGNWYQSNTKKRLSIPSSFQDEIDSRLDELAFVKESDFITLQHMLWEGSKPYILSNHYIQDSIEFHYFQKEQLIGFRFQFHDVDGFHAYDTFMIESTEDIGNNQIRIQGLMFGTFEHFIIDQAGNVYFAYCYSDTYRSVPNYRSEYERDAVIHQYYDNFARWEYVLEDKGNEFLSFVSAKRLNAQK